MLCLLACCTTLLFRSTAEAAEPFALRGQKTVIDQAGRRITVQQPFTRIISLYGAHTENLFALGCGPKVIGVGRHETFPPAALKKDSFSYHEDLERFLAARPDLVLVRPMIDRGYPELIQGLERLGVTVVSLQPRTVKDMFLYWRILGRLTGTATRAETMVSDFTSCLKGFHDLNSRIRDPQKVYFEAIHSKMKTFAPDSMAIFTLTSAGGINVARDARTIRETNIAAYGKERILSHAREIDVYLAQKGPMNQVDRATIRNEPGFQSIKAVRRNRIHILPEGVVSRPTMRLLKGIVSIGRILYPHLYTQELTAHIDDLIAPSSVATQQESP
jgi:iron complex transport system substrate-binding protein